MNSDDKNTVLDVYHPLEMHKVYFGYCAPIARRIYAFAGEPK